MAIFEEVDGFLCLLKVVTFNYVYIIDCVLFLSKFTWVLVKVAIIVAIILRILG